MEAINKRTRDLNYIMTIAKIVFVGKGKFGDMF